MFDEDAEDRFLRRQTRQKIDIANQMVQDFKEYYKEGVEPKLDNFVLEGFAKAKDRTRNYNHNSRSIRIETS